MLMRLMQTPLAAAKAQLEDQETKAKQYIATRQNTLSALQKNRKICDKYQAEVQSKSAQSLFSPDGHVYNLIIKFRSRGTPGAPCGAETLATNHPGTKSYRGGHSAHHQ